MKALPWWSRRLAVLSLLGFQLNRENSEGADAGVLLRDRVVGEKVLDN
jgi:hypothetical protein